MRVSGVEEDRRDFAGFYAAARDDCLQVVLISVGDGDLAEDLVAEAFTRAWMSWRRCARIRRRVPGSCVPR
jgi:RNA polymerase sigma-70 factor (ECF subfamily)